MSSASAGWRAHARRIARLASTMAGQRARAGEHGRAPGTRREGQLDRRRRPGPGRSGARHPTLAAPCSRTCRRWTSSRSDTSSTFLTPSKATAPRPRRSSGGSPGRSTSRRNVRKQNWTTSRGGKSCLPRPPAAWTTARALRQNGEVCSARVRDEAARLRDGELLLELEQVLVAMRSRLVLEEKGHTLFQWAFRFSPVGQGRVARLAPLKPRSWRRSSDLAMMRRSMTPEGGVRAFAH